MRCAVSAPRAVDADRSTATRTMGAALALALAFGGCAALVAAERLRRRCLEEHAAALRDRDEPLRGPSRRARLVAPWARRGGDERLGGASAQPLLAQPGAL